MSEDARHRARILRNRHRHVRHPGIPRLPRHKGVPSQRHFTKAGTKTVFPDIKDSAFSGAIQFYDARVDDARLVIDVVRTAASYGALAASRTQVVGFTKDASGRVIGAELADLETGERLNVRAKHVINATGVWTEESESLANPEGTGGSGIQGYPHRGSPRPHQRNQRYLHQDRKVCSLHHPLAALLDHRHHRHPYTEDRERPVATSKDIDYVLMQANKLLANPLTREDIIGTYTGLRPLLQPKVKDGAASTKVSREHTVTEVAPGMSAIAGGKLTTYRVMAADAVDFALGEQAKQNPSVTATIYWSVQTATTQSLLTVHATQSVTAGMRTVSPTCSSVTARRLRTSALSSTLTPPSVLPWLRHPSSCVQTSSSLSATKVHCTWRTFWSAAYASTLSSATAVWQQQTRSSTSCVPSSAGTTRRSRRNSTSTPHAYRLSARQSPPPPTLRHRQRLRLSPPWHPA